MEEEREIWLDIKGFRGYYQVSNFGRVKSLKRTVWDNRGCYRTVFERILKPVSNGHGYLRVWLSKNNKGKYYLIHQLVAQAFIQFVPEANTSYEVDHRNTERTDNRVSNLCFVTSSQNKLNPKTRERNINKPKKSKPVIAIDKVTGLIIEFPSTIEAERKLGISSSNICDCLKGRHNSSGGFYWMYADDNANAE